MTSAFIGSKHSLRPSTFVRSFDSVGSARSLDVPVFRCAAAIVAVHVAVGSFVAPETGTGLREHLFSGGAARLVLASAAAVYSRLPVGGRAAVAAVLGVLAFGSSVRPTGSLMGAPVLLCAATTPGSPD